MAWLIGLTAVYVYLEIVVITAVARFLLGAVKRLFDQVAAERFRFARFYPEWAMPTYSLVRFFGTAVATVMAFPWCLLVPLQRSPI